ncbi:DUF3291 domain-containing protein [Pedobacter arcticus]|uniref:DUF3291 domain-containing protein n=1 Tax=Pedobacter arcticus TaxID=752140 RepID=UPI0002EDCF5B|nr:DUF3291 domain-containing protein [Pedobacter arcticus]
MLVSITLVRYSKALVPFAFIAMAIHRLPLYFNSKISFWKLLGCGKNGTFDINPDFQQWGLLAVWQTKADFDEFQEKSLIAKWWRIFCFDQSYILLEPTSSHGKWSGKEPFGNPKIRQAKGRLAVLTRATIRPNKLKNFWRNVPPVASIMGKSKGFITSIGIGEAPFFMQATFSIWETVDDVVKFAYKDEEHAKVVKLTRDEGWYSEELFARFIILETHGKLIKA